MRLESSTIAKLLLLISIISNTDYRAEAQNEPLGRQRYQKVASISEDSAGNFLLLNLQSNTLLAAPSIQILNRQDGKSTLLADFTGLVWSQESRLFKAANRDIESIRVGQFQESPPVLRVSITSSNPSVFKKIEFANRGKALLIKFPERAFAYDIAPPIASPAVPSSGSDKNLTGLKATALSISKLPPVAPDLNSKHRSLQDQTVSKRTENDDYRSYTAAKNRNSQTGSSKQFSTDNPPFRKGGLYMNLGTLDTPADSSRASNAENTGTNYPAQQAERGLVKTDTVITETTISTSSTRGVKATTYKSAARNTYLTDLPLTDSKNMPLAAPQYDRASSNHKVVSANNGRVNGNNAIGGTINSGTQNSLWAATTPNLRKSSANVESTSGSGTNSALTRSQLASASVNSNSVPNVASRNGDAATSLPEAGKALTVADRQQAKHKHQEEQERRLANELKVPSIRTWPPQESIINSQPEVQANKKSELSNKIKNELKKDLRSSLGTDLEKAESVKPEKAQGETSKVLGDSSNKTVNNDDNGLAPCPTLEYLSKAPYKMRLKFPSSVTYKAFRIDNPPRYVIDVDNVDLSTVATQEPEQNPFLKTIRFGNPEPTRGRIVLDLAQDKTHAETEVNANQDCFSISLSNDASDLTDGLSLKGLRTVVLDAGHGGSDPGAQRGDVQEKDLTMAITNRLKKYLESHGVKVRMTRSDDTFVSLEDRVRICRESHPDAFVSIHINSLETDRDIKGIETYYQTEPSRALADKIHIKLVDGLKVPDRSVRKARFYVVNHSEQPAVLAEVGFISNKDERDKLISSDYQEKIAESVGQGVILFLTNPTEPVAPAISTSSTNNNLQFTNRLVPMLAKQGLSAIKQESKDSKDNSIANTLMKRIAQDRRNPN